jgi:hypothetical protein
VIVKVTSGRLAAWLALVTAVETAAAEIPPGAPGWVAVWLPWAARALLAGTAVFIARSAKVTLPADGPPRLG